MVNRWRCKLYAIDTLALLAPGVSVLVLATAANLVSANVGLPPSGLCAFVGREAWMMFIPGLMFARTVHRHLYAARGLERWARRQTKRVFLAEYFLSGCVWAVAGVVVGSDVPGFPRLPRPPAALLEAQWFVLGSLFGAVGVFLGFYALVNWAATRPLRRLGSHVYCERCGYVLDGLTGERCPECGHELCQSAFASPFGKGVFLR